MRLGGYNGRRLAHPIALRMLFSELKVRALA